MKEQAVGQEQQPSLVSVPTDATSSSSREEELIAALSQIAAVAPIEPVFWLLGIVAQAVFAFACFDFRMLLMLLGVVLFFDARTSRLRGLRSAPRVLLFPTVLVAAYAFSPFQSSFDNPLALIAIFLLRVLVLYVSIWDFFAAATSYDLERSATRFRMARVVIMPLVLSMRIMEQMKEGLTDTLVIAKRRQTPDMGRRRAAVYLGHTLGKAAVDNAVEFARQYGETCLTLKFNEKGARTQLFRRSWSITDPVFLLLHVLLLLLLIL